MMGTNIIKSRRQVYEAIEWPERSGPLARWVDICLIILIACNVCAVTFETVHSIYIQYSWFFDVFEIFSVIIFTLEYALRLWVSVERKDFTSRLRYALTPIALIDALAILPFYLSFIFGIDLRFLRVLRLLRIFKLTRYSSAFNMLLDVFREEASAFVAGFSILFVLLILAASGAYLAEHIVQPEEFGSIPHAMWWAMATLTTVGYGDVTPVTVAGKVFGGLVTVVGVGMAALPAGILASGLADQLHRRRDNLRKEFRAALEDGHICAEEEDQIEELRQELGISKEIAEIIREDVRYKMARLHKCPHCGTQIIGTK